jgi:hypothetical protein
VEAGQDNRRLDIHEEDKANNYDGNLSYGEYAMLNKTMIHQRDGSDVKSIRLLDIESKGVVPVHAIKVVGESLCWLVVLRLRYRS